MYPSHFEAYHNGMSDHTLARYLAEVRQGRAAEVAAELQRRLTEEQLSMVRDGLASGDPFAMERAGQLLSWQSTQLADRRVGPNNDPYNPRDWSPAWQLAACDRGANCSADAYRVLNGCANQGACGYTSLEAYMQFNEEMHKAGVLVASEGLNPAGKGARIEVQNGRRTVIDGPFSESKELVGGFYLVDVKSLDEAISWALRCPSGLGFDDVLDIRQLTAEEDLPPEMIDLINRVAPTWSQTFNKSRR